MGKGKATGDFDTGVREGVVNVYLGQPGSQLQAHMCSGMPVCISYANWSRWMEDYSPSWSRVLVDSGAFSSYNSGTALDVHEYIDWAEKWRGIADAIASIDDIAGDYEQTITNCEAMPKGIGFPTYHESDPPEVLSDLISLAYDHGGWLGLGLIPPRANKESWLRDTLEMIPDDLHVHGWACRGYTHLKRLDSVDSTNWFRDSHGVLNQLPWLTPAEALEIIIKRYQRENRGIKRGNNADCLQDVLF